MDDPHPAPSAPPLPEAPARSDSTYESIYRALLLREEDQNPDTSCDEAIARALAADAPPPPPPPPPPDTSLDAQLALQIHEDEVGALCGRAPPDVDTSGDLDAAIGRALSGSKLLKLVPRLNPFPAPRPLSGRDRERDRLAHRLAFYGLTEREVLGDGNCQFRALSDQLFRSQAYHMLVRARVLGRLAADPDRYAPFCVGASYGDYVASMAKGGTWGDHLTIQAAADAYGIRIYIITSFLENAVIEITPLRENPTFRARALHLSFWAEFHYGSVYPRNGPGSDATLLGSRTLRQGFNAVRSLLPG